MSDHVVVPSLFCFLHLYLLSIASYCEVALFTLLHTNDSHNNLRLGQSELLRRLRFAIQDRGLLLDAGDAVASGNITFHFAGETILNAMSVIGYDAMTVGNREFHFTRRGFECKLRLARFPILCANIRSDHLNAVSDGKLPTIPFIISDLGVHKPSNVEFVNDVFINENSNGNLTGTLRVAIMGLTVPMITEKMLIRHASAYVFEDPLQVAARLAVEIRSFANPDIVVALTHIGLQQDRMLAKAVPEIDLIIGGHSHDILEHGERVGDTLIVQSGSHSRYLGRVEIQQNDTMTNAVGLSPRNPSVNKFNMVSSLIPLPSNPTEAEMQAILRLINGPSP